MAFIQLTTAELELFNKDIGYLNAKVGQVENSGDTSLSTQGDGNKLNVYISTLTAQKKLSNIEIYNILWNEAILLSDIDLNYLKKLRLYLINEAYEIANNELKSGIPSGEIESYLKQEQEAKSYVLNKSADTTYIDTLAKNRNIDKDILVQKIIEKATLFTTISAELCGRRQKAQDSIEKAKSLSALSKITF